MLSALGFKTGNSLDGIKTDDLLKKPVLFRFIRLYPLAVLHNHDQRLGYNFPVLPDFQVIILNNGGQLLDDRSG